LVLLAFYQWNVDPSGRRPVLDPVGNDHYNLLLRGWLKGQLAMDVPPDPVLDAMANPYDPAQRGARGVHDASYFRGRHYLYFGAAPVLLLHAPVHALTGKFITPTYAVFVFAGAALLVGAGLWRALCRRVGTLGPVYWLGLLALAVGNFVVPFLRRPDVWEIAIACAHLLFLLTLVATWRAMESPRRAAWFAGASLLLGLAIASRPVYLAAGFVMLAPLWRAAQELGWKVFLRRADWWRLLGAGLAPLALVGLVLAWHNYARFGDPFEAGHTYQLAGMEDHTRQSAFGGAFVLYNLRIYLLTLPQFTAYFPFLTVSDLPPAPTGYIGTEDVQGVLLGAPWVLLGLALLVPRWRPRGIAGPWVVTLALAGGGVLLLLSSFGGATNRYIVDFFPALVIVGGVGALGLAAGIGRARPLFIAVGAALAVWSAAFNVMMALQHNRLLEVLNPEVYHRVARWGNWLPWAVERVRGIEHGPLELRVVFPEEKLGAVECLVATGSQIYADYLYVQRIDGHRIRFGFEHTAYGGGIGPFVEYLPGQENVIQIEMGSLYPPESHPYFRGMTPEEVARRKRRVRVLVNGREAFALPDAACFQPTEMQPSIGTSGPARPAFKADFSGRIVSQRRAPLTAESLAAEDKGPLHLIVQLPAWSGPVSWPLVCSGRTGAGDLIYLRRLAENRIVIGHDHWGAGAAETEPLDLVPGERFELRLDSPALRRDGSTQGLTVELNGKPVYSAPRDFHPSLGPAVIGANAIGASTAVPDFRGGILSATRR
jgi:hypothetical protein